MSRSNYGQMLQRSYKEEITEMLESINDVAILRFIYGAVRSGYREDKTKNNIQQTVEVWR